MRTLLLLLGLSIFPVMAVASPPPMPEVVVLILCKVEPDGQQDQNASYTHHQSLKWKTEGAMMVCRRQEVQVFDADVDKGADPQAFDANKCWRAAMVMGPNWDTQHPNSSYRFWRVACPVPMMNDMGTPDTRDDQIIGWVIPDCGHRDTVLCEVDTAI